MMLWLAKSLPSLSAPKGFLISIVSFLHYKQSILKVVTCPWYHPLFSKLMYYLVFIASNS